MSIDWQWPGSQSLWNPNSDAVPTCSECGREAESEEDLLCADCFEEQAPTSGTFREDGAA